MLSTIVNEIVQSGGRAFEVGGCVRDYILSLPCKDLDIEVFDLDADTLTAILEKFGRVDQVGASFGVIKLKANDGTEFDFTLPRRESKTGQGHRGFQVDVDHTMTLAEAAARRDYTLNAIYRCASNGEILDPHGGLADLNSKTLKATSPHFAEDPLRVLRGMQFAARFDMSIDSHTASLARSLRAEYSTLARERVWAEWHKWATRGRTPSCGLRLLESTGWLELYPELSALIDVPQDPEWHPEGDVWTHTQLVCDAAAAIADREELDEFDRTVLIFSALCHDLGKATTTKFVDGRWRARGHCEAGVPLTRRFLESIGCPESIIVVVEPLVAEHLAHANPAQSPKAVRRLSHRLGDATMVQLVHLVEADMNGRPPLPRGLPDSVRQMMEIAGKLNVQKSSPQPIILGRHLIALGHQPDVWFGDVLRACFEAQLDGDFESEAEGIRFLKKTLSNQ
ncbi:CCA tRNA nucleotidyltransferase [Fuerstiella marisgermanici]|uniref:Multifunctional CCA protein n=1 Tax=Fuerstiella marisgermanici TaxID=1891926 RepID=A0A1P8WGR8_9PLAN|nr:HD domain-containing protein [Fuerstiella marisgermanici]APZ93244.1 Multifunctional CCA protein [Fuerstiella marisgermanici]